MGQILLLKICSNFISKELKKFTKQEKIGDVKSDHELKF